MLAAAALVTAASARSVSGCHVGYEYSHGRAWCPPGTTAANRNSSSSRAANILDQPNPLYQKSSSNQPPAALVSSFTNVKGAAGRVYDLKDSKGDQMASLHLLDGATTNEYTAVYMSPINMLWEVRAAVSSDLLTW